LGSVISDAAKTDLPSQVAAMWLEMDGLCEGGRGVQLADLVFSYGFSFISVIILSLPMKTRSLG
jgi:hypothetical protein